MLYFHFTNSMRLRTAFISRVWPSEMTIFCCCCCCWNNVLVVFVFVLCATLRFRWVDVFGPIWNSSFGGYFFLFIFAFAFALISLIHSINRCTMQQYTHTPHKKQHQSIFVHSFKISPLDISHGKIFDKQFYFIGRQSNIYNACTHEYCCNKWLSRKHPYNKSRMKNMKSVWNECEWEKCKTVQKRIIINE